MNRNNTEKNNKKFKVIGIGEILWDNFPGGKLLGGAISNFSYHISSLCHEGLIISRIGKDIEGREILDTLKSHNLCTDYIQIDGEHQTGEVNVIMDINKQPGYIIKENVAWDFIEWDHKLDNLKNDIDAVCFGTLAQRNDISRNTITQFLNNLKKTTLKILDLNLRQDFYDKNTIEISLNIADLLKLNSQELEVLNAILINKKNQDEKELCLQLIKNYQIKLVCLTKGEEGSMIISENTSAESPVYPYTLADRVGAGDAFTAAVAIQYLKGESMERINDYANRLASWVTSKPGGMPFYDNHIKNFLGLS